MRLSEPKQVATKGSQTVGYLGESAKGDVIQKIPRAVWLSSSLLIVVLFLSSIMLMVTVRSSPHSQYAAPHDQATQSTPEVHPLVRTRQTTTTTKNTSDEVVRTRIQEVFKRPGYNNPDPDPEDYADETVSDVATRSDSPGRNRRLRPIGKDFDPGQSMVIKHPNGTISYVFPESISPALTTRTEKPNNDVTYRTSIADDNKIIFPDDAPPGYPTEEINAIIAKYGQQYNEIFGEEVLTNDKLLPRFDFSDEEFLCASVEKLTYPKSGTTPENTVKLIANTDKYIQGVRIETCSTVGKPCDHLASGSLYKTECRQLYHYRTLLSVDTKTQNVTKELFRLPSCCKCVRISNGSLIRQRRKADGL
ncbi:uncharacterized protein LOC129717891 isoform X2 [Wyeomyia smithii]|uniref:uncharacterized protein LOC129717891 isoform X2 n=1 Tax=Wyeomyia smithii TaxID=174621 RepID=UPI002467F9B1|nr:uncharacterized protein LOC129717891 isoform X2 [Wyeomyia smithii]